MALLSIIMPVYNAAKTIGRTLDSLQIIKKKELVELVVVDDGSVDDGMKILNDKRNKLAPLQFKIITQTNAGTCNARNRGLDSATGEWIMFLDNDDELQVDCLEYAQNNTRYDALGFRTVFYKNGKPCGDMPAIRLDPKNYLDVL